MPKIEHNNVENRFATRHSWLDRAFFLVFAIFAMLALRYQFLLLSYQEWGDESETIVAAKMMASGMRLYSDIFNHHGPLTFLPGLVLEHFGKFGVPEHRMFIAGLQLLAIVSLYTSPLLKNKERVLKISLAVLAGSIIVVFMPALYGQMYKYQTIAGLFLVIILSQYCFPAILQPERVNRFSVVVANFLLVCLPFFAITFAPLVLLLFLAALQSHYLKLALLGALVALVFNLVFLGVYGSFAGYLAFHYYLNLKILPFYSGSLSLTQLLFMVLGELVLAGAVFHLKKDQRLDWRSVCLFMAIGSLLIRGADFHALPYYYALLAFLVPLFVTSEEVTKQTKLVALGVCLFCVLKVSLILPDDMDRILADQIPKSTEFSRWVGKITNKEDKIIAYSFANYEYLAADRLPASGHFFYLPWQAKYNENPQFGMKIDACQQIADAKPKVMLINKWLVWDRYPWVSYAGCVQGIVDESYVQIPDTDFFVRKDLAHCLNQKDVHKCANESSRQSFAM